MPEFMGLFTPNSAMHTAFVQVGLKEDHHQSSFVYMRKGRERIGREIPELETYFRWDGLGEAVLNQGMPAPIDVQVSGMDLHACYRIAQGLARQFKLLR